MEKEEMKEKNQVTNFYDKWYFWVITVLVIIFISGIVVVINIDSKKVNNISEELRNKIDIQKKEWEELDKAARNAVGY